MAKAKLLSTASTHSLFTGNGVYYGVAYDPVAGGTIVVTDALDVGHKPDLNNPSTMPTTFLMVGPFDTGIIPADMQAPAVGITDGLTVSYTSTSHITVYYDD